MPVGAGDIEIAIAVKVADRNTKGCVAGVVERRSSKRAIPCAEEYRDFLTGGVVTIGIVSAAVGDDNIDLAVVVQISQADSLRHAASPRAVVHRRRECSVSVAEQNADVVRAVVGGD